MSEESEYIRVMELQRTTIKLLEKLLEDYKSLYASEHDQANQLRDILDQVKCPGFETIDDETKWELKYNYVI